VKSKSLRVIAVDDDPLVLINTVAMLEDLGHEVHETTSASKALEIINSGEAIDLVVTDQAMPGMSGLQFAEVLYKTHPHIRVIIATGYAELPADTPVQFTKLAKPFSQTDLARALADAPTAGGLTQRVLSSVRRKTNL
jgi:CheY-like chemotaxis protein